MYYVKRNQAIEYIILANALVFFATFIAPKIVGSLMVLQPITVLHQPWTLLTTMFVHADFSHILFNMIGLFFFGTYLERIVGEKDFLKTYFIGGLFASLAYTFISLGFGIPDPKTIAIGASGAVSALIGALIMLRPNLTVYLYFLFPMPLWIFGTVFVLMEPFLFPNASIAYTAHISGLIAGLAFGYYFKKKTTQYYQYEVSYKYGY
ncbi:MAG: rhomboid family intramembrane serine protease [Candidatus Altiarchaeota archaeon]|nr:rhomboid family intramembrane serine protease [Candidatus Altiarchaeota archaeon]